MTDHAPFFNHDRTLADLTCRWGRSWVEVDPAALRRNFRRLAACCPSAPRPIIACIKKDGYGHGLLTVARALAGESALWGYGVATVEEALALRRAAGLPPEMLVLLLAPIGGEPLTEALAAGVTLTVTGLDDARLVEQAAAALGQPAAVHLKLDTGMGRLGRLGEEALAEIQTLRALPGLRLEAIYSHLADAWNDPASRRAQWDRMTAFRKAAGLEGLRGHWGGSDGLSLEADLAPGDALRIGIALYGDHPAAAFEPAMTFKTRVIYRRSVPAGTAISYGSTFVTTRPTELALAGAGYGNGLPRVLSGRADVLIGGRRCPILGRVCMDQIVVDVTDRIAEGRQVAVDDEVVIFGRQTAPDGTTAILPAAEQARHAGTISYELFCLAGQINPHRVLPDAD